MLRIEVDLFSGRPNPVWFITNRAETERFLGAVAERKGVTAKQGAGFTGLGFREVRVSLVGDDEPRKRKKVPTQFALASIAAKELKPSGALARRLIEAMPIRSEIQLREYAITPLNARLRDGILERLER